MSEVLPSTSAPRTTRPGASLVPVYVVVALWLALLVAASVRGADLAATWPASGVAFWAGAVWGLNVLVLYYGVGPPFTFGRIPVLSAVFALLMTVFGSASYWATTQLFPVYRVFIERAALFVALCTLLSLVGCIAAQRWSSARQSESRWEFVWDWGRLRVLTYALLMLCLLGTYITLRRIGYIPLLKGDPESLRVEFPEIGGLWYRLSVLGIVVGLVAGAQICAGRASSLVWLAGVLGLVCASFYGNRFFVALPVAALVLLWDQVRKRITRRAVVTGFLVGVPTLALLGFWRQQDTGVNALAPLALVLYGTLSEFRDLGWTMDYYSGAHPLLHGSTMGGVIVPLLPSPLWSAVGIDKAAIYAHSNAAVLAQEMGQATAQRVGVYGELFMNFGWIGALAGALIYGVLVGYLDRGLAALRTGDAVRGIILAVVAAATIYAQVGQWNMFTSTITGSCYPILLLALFSARRKARIA